MDRRDSPDEEFQFEEPSEKAIRSVPTLHYWHKTYAKSMGGQDQKAVHLFKEYESQEKLRRLQQELMSMKDNQVSEMILDQILGKKRKMKYAGYHKWAALMLLWIAQYKR